jgi:hypothetical protein
MKPVLSQMHDSNYSPKPKDQSNPMIHLSQFSDIPSIVHHLCES